MSTTRLALSLSTLAALAGLALAQPANPPGDRPAPPPPLLRGPAVDDAAIPGTQRAFSMEGSMEGAQARMLNQAVPMNEFLAAFRALNAPETPENLRLTPSQRETLGQIAREHAQALRTYMEDNRQELQELGSALGFEPDELARFERGPADQPGAATPRRARRDPGAPGVDGVTPPGEGDPAALQSRPMRNPEQAIRERVGDNPTPQQRDAIARLRELRTGAPGGLEAQTRAWNILTEPQQEFVQARLDESRARLQAQRGEMYVQELAQRLGQEGGERQVPPQAGELPPGEAAARLHRLIDELSPREQGMLLRLLEARLPELRARASQAPDAEGRPGRPGAPTRRPAPPPMDQINVPPADPV